MNQFSSGELRQLQTQITDLQRQIASLKQQKLPDHKHTGFDASKVMWSDITGKTIDICHTIVGADAATAANYNVFYIVKVNCYLTKFQEVHSAAGTAGGSVTVNLERLTGTQAADSGTNMLDAGMDLKDTANEVHESPYLAENFTRRTLAPGDRICLKDTGTLTSVSNLTVYVELTVS